MTTDVELHWSRLGPLQPTTAQPTQSPLPLPDNDLAKRDTVSTERACCRTERVAHWYWQDDLGGWRRYLDLDRFIEAHYCAFQADQGRTPSLSTFTYRHETNVTYCIDFVKEIQSRVPHVTPAGQLYQVRRIRRVERKLVQSPQAWPRDWIDLGDAAMRVSRSQRCVVPAPFLTLGESTSFVSSQDTVSPMLAPTEGPGGRTTVEVLWLERTASDAQPNPDAWSDGCTSTLIGTTSTAASGRLARAASSAGSAAGSVDRMNRFIPASMFERDYALQPLELNAQLYQHVTAAYLSSVTHCIRRSPASVAAVLPGSASSQPAGTSHPEFITAGYRASVVGAWQIQSPRILARYVARRQRIQEEVDALGVVSVEQRTLFHGTSFDALPHILRDGLRAPLSTSTSDRALRGHGIYLARAASFATYYALQHKDPLAVVLVCDALVGLTELGERGQREARRVPNADGGTFHSTCDALWNAVPTQHCLWKSDQVLPVALLFVKCEPLTAPPATAVAS
jgi:hypothetical protein